MRGRGNRVLQQRRRPSNRTSHGCIACDTFSLIAPIHDKVILGRRQNARSAAEKPPGHKRKYCATIDNQGVTRSPVCCSAAATGVFGRTSRETISRSEMGEAIARSGYPLEQRVEQQLSRRSYFVEPSDAFLDPDTQKSGELDMYASGVYGLFRDWDSLLTVELLCECENNAQPVAFFVRKTDMPELGYFNIKMAGTPQSSSLGTW